MSPSPAILALLYLLQLAALQHADRARTLAGIREAPVLRVLAGFEFEAAPETTSIVDLRWASRDSVYVLRLEDGVTEHRLVEGLPSSKRVLPGRRSRILGGNFLSVSGSHALAATNVASFVWRELGGADDLADFPDDFQAIWPSGGGIGDAELGDAEVFVIGHPSHRTWMGRQRRVLLWRASLADGLQDWTPFSSLKFGEGDELNRGLRHLYAFAASMRFLPNGDLFVYRGHPPVALLISPSGEVKREWNVIAALAGNLGALSTLMVEGFRADDVHKWADKAWVVEEALFVGKDPALVLREVHEGLPAWYLVILDVDEGTWYRVPFATRDTSLRLRADGSRQGEIAFVAGPRMPAREGSSPPTQRLVVAALP